MQLISDSASLKSHLSRLIKKYSNISMGVAWASASTEVFKTLLLHKAKIQTAVIGSHFYQTHPDVLDAFVDSSTVKFVLQPQGVFHPKVFVFWDNKNWEVLIGSANLTAGAMGVNTELCTLITQADGSPELKNQVLECIDGYQAIARTITQEDSDNYRRIWLLKQPVLHKLAGQYGSTASKSPVDSPIMAMSWEQFFKKIQEDKLHGFDERCDFLHSIGKEFIKTVHYRDMTTEIRQAVAGLPNSYDKRWAWFGSMKGVGYFFQAVNDNNPHLSNALDAIPLTGTVDKAQYLDYISQYIKAFPNGRDGVSTASRLLALKRPDYFVCLSSKNQDRLIAEFGIKKSSLDYEGYWDEVIGRIQDSPWWNSPEPNEPRSLKAWQGRSAMLDSIFYEE